MRDLFGASIRLLMDRTFYVTAAEIPHHRNNNLFYSHTHKHTQAFSETHAKKKAINELS